MRNAARVGWAAKGLGVKNGGRALARGSKRTGEGAKMETEEDAFYMVMPRGVDFQTNVIWNRSDEPRTALKPDEAIFFCFFLRPGRLIVATQQRSGTRDRRCDGIKQ